MLSGYDNNMLFGNDNHIFCPVLAIIYAVWLWQPDMLSHDGNQLCYTVTTINVWYSKELEKLHGSYVHQNATILPVKARKLSSVQITSIALNSDNEDCNRNMS